MPKTQTLQLRYRAIRQCARRLSVATVIGLSVGCMADNGYQPPRTALVDYAQALSDGRIEDAHALLSKEAQARLPLNKFRRMITDNPREIQDITAHLLQGDSHSEITAEVLGPDGSTLQLVYEKSTWKISASALDLYAQHTPETTIASFLRAYENRRYDVLLNFVPEKERQQLSVAQLKAAWEGDQKLQIERLTQALKAALPTLQVEVIGPRATVGYGAGGTVELVNEHGIWKIEDI